MFSKRKKDQPVYKKKRFLVPATLLLLLLVLRIAAPPLIRSQANHHLEDFSPTLKLEIGDVDLALLRGSYSMQAIRGKIKSSGEEFLSIRDIEVDIPWREIIKGRVAATIMTRGLDFTYSDELLVALKTHLAHIESERIPEEEPEKKPLVPVRIDRFDLKESLIRVAGRPELTKDHNVAVSNLEGRATNLMPTEEHALTLFNFNGHVLRSAHFKIIGELNLLRDTPAWSVDGELQNFHLKEANPFLRANVPLSFESGVLDVYAEALGSGGKRVEGYLKPFMKNVQVLGSPDDFKNFRHWIFDILAAAGTSLLEAEKTDTVATRVPFSFDGEMHLGMSEAVKAALKHGFDQRLVKGIENRYELSVQAEEDRGGR